MLLYSLRRCLTAVNINPPVALTLRLQEAVDRWPIDPTKKHRDIRIYLEQRARRLIVSGTPWEKLEQEADCLERLASNVYRDRYPIPHGLGEPSPIIAATGLDLPSITAILSTGGDSKPTKGLLSRLLRFFG